jgi:hypothetical protein
VWTASRSTDASRISSTTAIMRKAYVYNSPLGWLDPTGQLVTNTPLWCQQESDRVSGRKDTEDEGSSGRGVIRELTCDPNNWLPGPVAIRGPVVGIPRVAARIIPKSIQKKIADATGLYPLKPGGRGLAQPYDPITGKYVPKVSPSETAAGRFMYGVGEGYAAGKSGAPLPPSPDSARAWGQAVGQFFGNMGWP